MSPNNKLFPAPEEPDSSQSDEQDLFAIELDERLEFGAAIIDSDLGADTNYGCTNTGNCVGSDNSGCSNSTNC
jgi:hypothetical protein